MTLEAAVCPFCNSVLSAIAAAPTAEKLPCPRCGEPVPTARWPVVQSVPPSPAMSAAIRGGTPGTRATLFVILGVMLTMAVVSLSYALWTVKLRQARHPKMPEKQEAIAFRRPTELSGLGYLPKGTQVVIGLQIAEWLDDKAGKQLLEEPRPAYLDWLLKQVTRATSLKLEQLDHIIAASTLDTQLVLIVKTRQPYSLEKIVDAVQPVRSSNYQQKPLYEYALKPLGEAMLWCVEERHVDLRAAARSRRRSSTWPACRRRRESSTRCCRALWSRQSRNGWRNAIYCGAPGNSIRRAC